MMNKGTESDEGLMLRVARGQRECLSPLIRRHASGLLTYIQRMIGDRHRSEELFQEVFLAVWSKRRQYKFPRPFRAWLFGIATNRCRSEFRKARPEIYSYADGQPLLAIAGDPSPLDTAIATETSAIVARAVASLPPKQRSVIVLRVWNSLSYAEIGRVLQCSEATARSHMHHGLAGVRRYLEPRL
jgi:RNA polymerase sigma-70 factor (ECF subfamily)